MGTQCVPRRCLEATATRHRRLAQASAELKGVNTKDERRTRFPDLARRSREDRHDAARRRSVGEEGRAADGPTRGAWPAPGRQARPRSHPDTTGPVVSWELRIPYRSRE